jgi:hypothetical protein
MRAERPGCTGRGEGLKREEGKSGSGRPKVEYPEVRLRTVQAAQNPGADLRLRRELAHVAKDSENGKRRRREKRQGREAKLVTGTTILRGENRESQTTAGG